MNNNRIKDVIGMEQDDEDIILNYMAGQSFAHSFFTLTLNADDKFQLFFDEDAYRKELGQMSFEMEEEVIEKDVRFYVEEIEEPIRQQGGL